MVPPRDCFASTHQTLTHDTINRTQQAIYEPNASLYDVRVKVERIEETQTSQEEVRLIVDLESRTCPATSSR